MGKEQELRPCPHCGMPVTLQTSKTLGDRLFVIACPNISPCANSGLGTYVIAGKRDEAIAAWNRRAPAVAAGGVTEALTAAREWINAADHDEHCFTNDPNPDAWRCVCDKDSLIALIDDVTAALAVGDEGIREGWQPIETAPPAMHVMACRFDHDAGEWVYAVVMSPPIYPFTHWQPLPTPPSRGEGV